MRQVKPQEEQTGEWNGSKVSTFYGYRLLYDNISLPSIPEAPKEILGSPKEILVIHLVVQAPF